MTLTELKYVVAVATERHFGRAAERCFVSQPSLSAAVKNLEDELGVLIFERGKGEVLVTPIGAEVVAQARRALEEADRVKAIAAQGRNPLEGPLRLGIIHTVAPYLLPELVAALVRSTPRMPLDIEENLTANLDAMLRSGAIDAAIVALPFDAPGITVTALYSENFRVIVPAKHPLGAAEDDPARGACGAEPAAAQRWPLLSRPGARCLPRVHAAAGAGQGGQFAGDHP